MGIWNRITSLFSGNNWLIIPAALLAVVLHEIGHGYVAYLLGDRTAKDRGRLSLNPLRHIDPIGLICMVLFGFGWASPVPVNAYYFKNRKFGMCLTAIAGPLSNIVLAAVSCFFLNLLFVIPATGNVPTATLSLVSNFLYIFALLNVGLAVFNLIPIPPLDGSKILFAIFPQRMYGYILRYEQLGMLALIVLINFPFFSNIITAVRDWLFVTIFSFSSIIF